MICEFLLLKRQTKVKNYILYIFQNTVRNSHFKGTKLVLNLKKKQYYFENYRLKRVFFNRSHDVRATQSGRRLKNKKKALVGTHPIRYGWIRVSQQINSRDAANEVKKNNQLQATCIFSNLHYYL